MDHFEVKIGEVNKPAHLSPIKRLGLSEIGEVFMVGEDLYRERRAMKVVVLRLVFSFFTSLVSDSLFHWTNFTPSC